MTYVYILIAGLTVSIVHAYLVWHHRSNRKYSISEHAVIDKKSHIIYVLSHIICDVFILAYAYQFFIVEQSVPIPFYLFFVFAVLDFIQAILPSKGKTEPLHFVAAYVSWVCYLVGGVVSIVLLDITQPYKLLAILLLVPVVGMFVYMHINRSKLYPYQLMMVPLFVAAMILITVGAQ